VVSDRIGEPDKEDETAKPLYSGSTVSSSSQRVVPVRVSPLVVDITKHACDGPTAISLLARRFDADCP